VPEPFPIIEMTFSKKRTTAFPEQSFLVRSGKRIPISGTCSLIRDERQEVIGAIAVFQDVTKKHELDQLKDSFLSVAAHQLRTPLGSMRWSMELLLNGDLGELPDEAKEVLGQIYENSQRMTTLVNDLLDVSRIDQNRGHEEKKPVDLGGLLMDVVRTLSPEAEKHAVAISMALPSDSLPAIMAPPKHLYEAMENIVSNAIKYNRNENGKVHIAAEDIGRAVLITVSDNGIGIPKKDQSKIFSKFFRASNALLRETEGSGLGLSVVKSYIEESGAQVWFESEEGHGTKFFVKFPLVPTDS
jgi:signal transduction histidine kinase